MLRSAKHVYNLIAPLEAALDDRLGQRDHSPSSRTVIRQEKPPTPIR